MTTAPATKLKDLLAEFDTAMVVTKDLQGQLRARPMAIADIQPEGVLWFLTQRDSGKVDEIERDAHVCVTMQSITKFVSISGSAVGVEDRAKIAEIWNEAWKVWFPGGKSDPQLLLLKMEGRAGEYWDNSGASGLKYLIQAGKAYLSGTRPDVEGDPNIHGKVSL